MKKPPTHSPTRRVLIDTSAWIEHERKSDPILVELIERDQVVIHWAVYGELAVGNIKQRSSYLADLSLFPRLPESIPSDVFEFIEKEKLFAKGLSIVDCILLKDAADNDCLIYSLDQKLNSMVAR